MTWFILYFRNIACARGNIAFTTTTSSDIWYLVCVVSQLGMGVCSAVCVRQVFGLTTHT
jgi:hypothetical protein